MDLDETVYDKLPADDFGQSTAELNALIGNSHNTMKKFWTCICPNAPVLWL